MFAIENAHVQCVQALLTLTVYDLGDEFEEIGEGAQQLNVNAADTDGRTALTMALEKGDDRVGLTMAQMLLEFGADIDMEVKLADEVWKGKVRVTAWGCVCAAAPVWLGLCGCVCVDALQSTCVCLRGGVVVRCRLQPLRHA